MTALPRRPDVGVTAWLLAALLAWDFGAADLRIARLFASGKGFVARDSVWASALLHAGGRWLAWSIAVALVVVAMRTPSRVRGGPNRRQRIGWLAAMLVCALAVPALKQLSATSCPWDLAEFGGVAHYVSHWSWGVADGGPGHCFPAGHPVAAFAFLGMYFLWRPHDSARARVWLFGVLAFGTLLGLGQLARGAHYPSHTLWSAWICWAICAGADRLDWGMLWRLSRSSLAPAVPPAAP